MCAHVQCEDHAWKCCCKARTSPATHPREDSSVRTEANTEVMMQPQMEESQGFPQSPGVGEASTDPLQQTRDILVPLMPSL